MKKNTIVLISLLLIAPLPVLAETDAASPTDRLHYTGWFRVRYEGIDDEFLPYRGRGRFAGRFGGTYDVNDTVRVVLGLATGGDNPTSRNQTFDDGFSTKDIGLEFAYVDWSPTDNLHVFGGKMKNPLFRAGKAPLIWDSDVTPEGIALTYGKGVFFGTLANFAVEERASSSDSLVQAVQVGAKLDLAGDAKLTIGGGYLAYTNTIGNEPFYNGNPMGNTVDVNGNYVYDYKDTEAFAQYDTHLGGWPLSVYAQWVRNTAVDAEDTGYAFGAKIGSAHDKGDMEFSWTYMDIAADAVIGTFNDSDFGGGGTDHSGHLIKAKYAWSKNIAYAATGFINRVDRFTGTEHDFYRIQLDVEFKFE